MPVQILGGGASPIAPQRQGLPDRERKVLSTTAVRRPHAPRRLRGYRPRAARDCLASRSIPGPRRRGAPFGRPALIDEFDRESALRVQRRQQAIGAAIAVVRSDDAGAPGQRRENQRDGGEPRAGDDRSRAAFQVGQCAGQLIARRIAGSGVVVFARLAVTLECKIRRQVDRRYHGTVMRIGLETGANRSGGCGICDPNGSNCSAPGTPV